VPRNELARKSAIRRAHQWKSREDFDAMVKNPEAKAHIKPIMGIAETDFHLHEVADSLELSPNE
jgi:hypothetical protein